MTIIQGLTKQQERALEARLKAIYYRADKEVQKKAADFFSEFNTQDKELKKDVADGRMTENAYKRWRIKTLAEGKQYRELQKTIANEYFKADETAIKYINGQIPYQFISSYKETGKLIEGKVSGYSFNLPDAEAIRQMAIDDGNIKIASVRKDKVEHYVNKKARSEILQGLIQGESVEDVAKRLRRVGVAENNSSLRTARTLMNGAHNAGRYSAMEKAEKDGILIKKQWRATHDGRTRDSHAYLDGEMVNLDEKFSNGLMYPQDPNGRPEEVYNCRCRMDTVILGFVNKYTGKSVTYSDFEAVEYENESRKYWEEAYND